MRHDERQTATRERHTPTSRGSGAGRRASALVLVVVLALVVAACSSNHGSATAPSTTAAGGTPTTVAGGASTTSFGTLPSPCGKGTASGATADGVSSTSVTIGYGDDAGYAAAPGLDKEMSDAMKAMISWCNAQGGINGRKVVGNYYDAAVTQVAQAITKACNDKVFMLVGQGYVLDSGQETGRIGCKLPSIPAYSVSTAFANGSGVAEPLPNPGDQVSIPEAYLLAAKYPAAVKKAAFVYAKYPATQETRDKQAAAYPKAGWKFQNCDQIYNVAGESDWKPIATNLKTCGIDAVVWVGSPNPNFENLLSAAKQVGYTPTAWVSGPNQYDAGFAKWNGQNGGAGNNVYLAMAVVPFELSGQVPAVKQYLGLIKNSGGTAALLGVQATSAFLLWATSVKACGSNVTRSCVLDAAAKQKAWTAGGLHVPTNPVGNEAAKCGLLLKLDGGTWTKVAPAGGTLFSCSDTYRVTDLKTPAVAAAKLDANRVATQYGTFTPQ